ncbi:PREDICTED: protein SET DOMAIN GROUP 41 [Ipomoea nil]|uniref:protein SET DOMAIN GROUP 41 n=1 Tax=Ipomoea nil TaxID=35883 RepID=UPI000901BF29|nr:PREDICTED: protein SET DOMAIN GROUP 41 [Ipomoea nil]
MEMRAVEDVGIGQDLTPPVPPIAVALHDSRRFINCSACFSPLASAPSFSTNANHVPSPFLLYCSPRCASLDSPLHFSSAEFHLLRQSPPSTHPDSSDLRLSLRLLHRFETLRLVSRNDGVFDRIGGLMTNRAELLRMGSDEDDEVLERIKEGARAMAAARRTRDGPHLESSSAGECAVEEAVLCLVLTNAVEVQDSAGCSVGVAVYGPSFSWINHGCSPNSSYRFSTMPCSGTVPRLLIYPASNGNELINSNLSSKFLSAIGNEEGYGPRLIVRSIKAIKKGEELLIAYIDLLQPKGMRQSELWLKYRFTCCCNRCNADPATYVDRVLQEISVVDLDNPSSTSINNFGGDFAVKKLIECFDDAVDDFMTFNNPTSCSGKLENLLIHGYANKKLKPSGEKSRERFKLHPFHHLSLNAYTTLASAYKVLASELLALSPANDTDRFKVFSISKASAAYSLLLAGSTHHLFCFEPSLIICVANFWTSAGESLLSLVRSSLWDSCLESSPSFTEFSPSSSQSCNKCKASFIWSRDLNVELSETTRQFLNCITNLTPKVWHFLINKGNYLNLVKDPIDFRWIESTEFSVLPDHAASSELKSDSETEADMDSSCVRTGLFQIGFHCLLYGSFLSSVCCTQHPPSNGDQSTQTEGYAIGTPTTVGTGAGAPQ